MTPKFCYRVDLVDDVSAKTSTAPPPVRPLSGYALASRLSYFLWSSMPDEELVARAQAGDLKKPDILVAQARPMLKDDRARGLALDFPGNSLHFPPFLEPTPVT